ncbi:MAG TPA: hypothetical protein ENL08_00950 [Bacteroidetes bacterium]|nr:hypothetical protein [Bacteroidota bacterium]
MNVSTSTATAVTSGVVKVLLAIVGILTVAGCEGPVGPPGMNAEGVDITPPTIELLQPHPLSQVWDEFKVTAAAVDNVAIRAVIFSLDGSSLVNNTLLSDDSPPFEFTIEALGPEDARLFESGWHFIAARAYDTAGNITDSPLVPIRLGYADDLQDTVVMAYHNNVASMDWVLPDSARAAAYWTRFDTPKRCSLISVSLLMGGSVGDSVECFLTVWEGDRFPEQELFVDTLSSDSLSVEPVWRTYDLSSEGIEVRDDFFVMIGLDNPGETDSLVLASDDGLPPWQRGGSRDDRGLHLLEERYGARNNFLISCSLYFEVEEPPDTTLSLRNAP